MRQFTQANRRLKLRCAAAGDDVLQLVGFSGTEELSRPFQFTLELISNSSSVSPGAIVGKRVSFAIIMPDEAQTERWFDGFISGFTYQGTDERSSTSRYRAEVVPWLWFMGRTTDCRIFQNRSVPEIVREVLGDCPHQSFDDSGVQSAYPKREYCVQYRESDFDFVSRLMEDEGIFYFFKHDEGQHKLILADTKSGYVECKESKASLHSTQSQAMDEDLLFSWEHRAEFHSGAIASTDYNYKTPSIDLKTSATTTMKIAGVKDLELFEYPGNYPTTADGDRMVGVRMEEEESTHDVVVGKSRYCTYQAGGRFTLEKHYNAAEEGTSWALISVRHEASLGGSYTSVSQLGGSNGSEDSEDAGYTNEFVCIPAETTFRPRRVTPRPVVGGLQTAIVVGEAGQEIQVDNLGRIRVQFFWDRRGKKKADVSRWVRVAQTWAGAGYGAWFLPRVGHEVVLAFEDGDPDRPLCVGSVYHAENKQALAQPANKTQSGIKTRSSPGGGAGNANEIRFEDKKGGEELYFHAEKNQTIEVENDCNESVGHNRTEKVGNDSTETIGHDETITIQNDRTDTVHGNETRVVDKDRTRTVSKNETITVALNRTHTVGINEAITVGAAQEVTVGAMQTITVGAIQTTSVGANQSNTIGASQSNTIGANRTISVTGGQTTTVGKDRSATVGKDDTLSVAKNLVITAGDSVTITTGSASITMKKDGTITIKGKDITIDGSGAITVKASKNVVVKGQKILQN